MSHDIESSREHTTAAMAPTMAAGRAWQHEREVLERVQDGSGFLSQRPNNDALLQGCINAALESLDHGLAPALLPARVNTVSPGLIDTPNAPRSPLLFGHR